MHRITIMSQRPILTFGAMSVLTISGAAFAQPPVGPVIDVALERTAYFLDRYPGCKVHVQDERISRVYGRAFSHGPSPLASAKAFMLTYAEMFGVHADELVPGEPYAPDERVTHPVMYNRETGEYKFAVVGFSHVLQGIPVFRSHITLLVRNEPGYPTLLAVNNLKAVREFQVGEPRPIDAQAGYRAARAVVPDLETFGEVALVIWVESGTPRLAYQFVGEGGDRRSDDFQSELFIVDLQTNQVLHYESRVFQVDVEGNVFGMATEGLFPDTPDNPPIVMPLVNVFVDIEGGNSAFTAEEGDFVIPNPGSDSVNVRSFMKSEFITVINEQGPELFLQQDVLPPGPADFVHNAKAAEFATAQVNGYLHANLVRDFVVAINPTFPGMTVNLEVNVNRIGECAARYFFNSLRFFASGEECPNTAYSTVVYHEFCHFMLAHGGNDEPCAYAEGISDSLAAVVADDPHLAEDFYGPGTGPLRNAENDLRYPCPGCTHECGTLLSGCIWETRNELVITEPEDFQQIIGALTVNSILLKPLEIDPGITIDFLSLDDDDMDIFNGTPHCNEIQTGFGEHNMAAPGVDCPSIVLGDLDGDGDVDAFDLAILLGSWGPCPEPCTPGDPATTCPADLDGNCDVGPADLAFLLGNWG